jgi:hypothetical protein
MNVSRLREILEMLLEKEREFQIQVNLQELNNKFAELVAQPQNATIQSQFSDALEKLSIVNKAIQTNIEPAQISLLQEIGGDKYFTQDFTTEIINSIKENPLSPEVARLKLDSFRTERENYIQQITQLCHNLEALNIEVNTLEKDDVEIGFLLPRGLFNNRLDHLIKELRDINRIIRAFSEVTIGKVEEVEVRQISTSDPLFFFHLSRETIVAVGAAVSWALYTWKQVEEIRRVRAETRKTDVLTEKEASDIFDNKIHEKIEAAVKTKVDELIKNEPKSDGREKEQRIALGWALESILAHVERGMIVEIRFLLPSPKTTDEGIQADTTEDIEFQSLQDIAKQLVFPKMEGTPILKLPSAPSPDASNE